MIIRIEKTKSFNSKQLLEKREYDDGTVEEDYVSNSVAVMDENQNQIDASTVVAATATGYTYEDRSQSASDGVGSVSFIQTLYYTLRYTPPFGVDAVYKVNRVETRITNQTYNSYATQIEHGYKIKYDVYEYMNSAVVPSPTLNQTYTVYSIHQDYYPKDGGIQNGIFSYYIVTITGGSSVSGMIKL